MAMSSRAFALFTVLSVVVYGCDDNDSQTQPEDRDSSVPSGDGDGDGGDVVSEPLRAALDKTRASVASSCDVLDVCYPDLAEENWCGFETTEEPVFLQRKWPVPAADRCWEPLYQSDREVVLSLLSCLQENNKTFEDCVKSCPSETAVEACDAAFLDQESECNALIYDSFSDTEFDTYDACEARLAPEPA